MAAAAAALGLVGYLYALGGAVLSLRAQTAELTPDGAIVATADRHLLATGVRVVAFEIFLLIAISVIVSVVVGIGAAVRRQRPNLPEGDLQTFDAAWGDKRTLGGFIGPVTALILICVGLSWQGSTTLRLALWGPGLVLGIVAGLAMIFHEPPHKPKRKKGRWLRMPPWRSVLTSLGNTLRLPGLQILTLLLLVAAIGIGLFVLPLLQGTLLLAGTAMIYSGPFLKWPGAQKGDSFGSELLHSGGVWAAIAFATAVALAWVATPPVVLPRAVVESVDRSSQHPGGYLDRGDAGVYLGTCTVVEPSGEDHQTSTESRITLVPAEESARVKLGPATYGFDPGGRPSLWQAIKENVSDGSAGIHDAPLHHPLRGQLSHVCGTRDPAPKPDAAPVAAR